MFFGLEPRFVLVVLLVAIVVILVLKGGAGKGNRRERREPTVNRRCAGCGEDNPDRARYCRRCGRALS